MAGEDEEHLDLAWGEEKSVCYRGSERRNRKRRKEEKCRKG